MQGVSTALRLGSPLPAVVPLHLLTPRSHPKQRGLNVNVEGDYYIDKRMRVLNPTLVPTSVRGTCQLLLEHVYGVRGRRSSVAPAGAPARAILQSRCSRCSQWFCRSPKLCWACWSSFSRYSTVARLAMLAGALLVTVWMIAAAPPELRELLLAILNAQSRGAVSRPAALAPTATRALQLTAGARLRLFAEAQRHLLGLDAQLPKEHESACRLRPGTPTRHGIRHCHGGRVVQE